MKSILVGAAALAGSLALPFAAFAATYQYVSVHNSLMSVTAPDAATALTMAPDIAHDSGVMLVSGTPTSGDPQFQYVTATGALMTETAANAQAALVAAVNIAPHSGVIEVENNAPIPSNTPVTI